VPHLEPAEREQLILDHLRLVTAMAVQFQATARRVRLDWDDLIQEGRVGLVRAADGYDPEQRASFATYARFWVLSHLILACRQHADLTGLDLDRLPRKPRPPTLVPLFPVVAFEPGAPCPHHGPIRRGSDLVCMSCHVSGHDGHPALQRTAATDPKPEQKPRAPVCSSKAETRRQRRARLFSARANPV